MNADQIEELQSALADLREEPTICSSLTPDENACVQALITGSQVVCLDLAVLDSVYSDLCLQTLESLVDSGLHEKVSADELRDLVDLADAESIDWSRVKLPFERTLLYIGNKMQRVLEMCEDVKRERFTMPCAFLLDKDNAYVYYYTISCPTHNAHEMDLIAAMALIVKQGVPVIRSETAHILRTLCVILEGIADKGVKEAGLSYKLKLDKLRKKRKAFALPNKLHVVEMQPHEVKTLVTAHKVIQRATVRKHLVCEHDATWISRGKLPLDSKLEKALRRDERRVIIMDDSQITAEIQSIFDKRGIVHEPGEWISVLTVRRKQHTRGQGDEVETVHSANKLFRLLPHQEAIMQQLQEQATRTMYVNPKV